MHFEEAEAAARRRDAEQGALELLNEAGIASLRRKSLALTDFLMLKQILENRAYQDYPDERGLVA